MTSSSGGCHFFQFAARKERGRRVAKPQCIKVSIFRMATGNIVTYAFAVVTVLSMAFLLCCFRAFIQESRSPASHVTPSPPKLRRRELPFHPPQVITARLRTSNGQKNERSG